MHIFTIDRTNLLGRWFLEMFFYWSTHTTAEHTTAEHIELAAKLLDYFLRSNQSNINQHTLLQHTTTTH